MHPCLIIDIAGPELSPDDIRRLQHPLVAGVVHFSRHWKGREHMTALNAQIKAIRPDLLITVDHEGGRVQRFKSDGMTHLPAMGQLGQLWEETAFGQPLAPGEAEPGAMRAQASATAWGYVLGAELRSIGVDFSFTPVLDLNWCQSQVIGDRAFHANPQVVTLLAKSLIQGLNQAGLSSCGKHFPGHGFAKADSHHAMALDERSLDELLSLDAAPFSWLHFSLGAIMPAHVIYPKVDVFPAGFSKRWLTDILRGQLGFEGVIVTDDLSMAAARTINGQLISYADAVRLALAAGCDLALICNQSLVNGGRELDETLQTLSREIGRSSYAQSDASNRRIRSLLPKNSNSLSWDALMCDRVYQSAKKYII